MSRENHQRRGKSDATDDVRLTRRAAMALLGVGALTGATSGSASGRAGTGANRSAGASGSGQGQSGRPWNRDVDAQGHDLLNASVVETDALRTGHLSTGARAPDVVVWRDESGTYHADDRAETVHSGDDFAAAVQAAIDSLDDDRTEKRRVLVAASGTMGPVADGEDIAAIEIPSYTIVDYQGTVYVEDEGEPLVIPALATDATAIEVPRLTVVGNPRFGLLFNSCSDVHIGQVEMDVESLAVRIDDSGDGRSSDVRVDSVYVENAANHAFETYGVDRLQVGRVLAKNTEGGAGCLLNDTYDATVGMVVGKDVDVGGGYAAFRVANGCHDVTCGQVVCDGGARGVFGVSACSEITIGQVNLRNLDAHGVLIQDCQNFTIEGGVVRNCEGEAIRVDSRSSPQHPPAEGVCVTNVRVVDTQEEPTQTHGILETGPDTANNRFVDNDLRDAGTEANMDTFAASTVVRDNVGAGVADGTVTLVSGESPAAVVEGITEHGDSTLDLRAKPRSAPDGAFAYDHRFEWTGDAWNLVLEWETDPDEDVDLDYVVDRPQANIGLVEPGEGGDEDRTELVDGATYTVTSALNADDVLLSVEGDLEAGANVYMQTAGEESGQEWTLTELDGDLWRIDAADAEGIVLTAEGGGTETGTNLVVDEWAGEGYQRWALEGNGAGYTLEPSHANLAADVWETNPDPGADVRHWEPSDGENQTFIFEPVDDLQGEFPFETTEGVVESFEDGSLDGYEGATGDYEVTQDSPVAHGDDSLKGSGGEGSAIVTTDLARSPAPGTTFSARIGSTEDARNAGVAFGATESGAPADGDDFPFHFVRLWRAGEEDWRFQIWDRTGAQLVDNSLGATQSGVFHEVVVDWSDDGSMTVTLNDPDGAELASHDVDPEGGSDWGDGGIGTRGTGLLDDVRILENRR